MSKRGGLPGLKSQGYDQDSLARQLETNIEDRQGVESSWARSGRSERLSRQGEQQLMIF